MLTHPNVAKSNARHALLLICTWLCLLHRHTPVAHTAPSYNIFKSPRASPLAGASSRLSSCGTRLSGRPSSSLFYTRAQIPGMRSHVPGAIIGASTCGRSTGRPVRSVLCGAVGVSTLRSRLEAPAARPSPTRPVRASGHVPWAVLDTGGLTPLRALEASGLAAASHATILKLSEAKGSLPVSLTRDASPENLAQESK